LRQHCAAAGRHDDIVELRQLVEQLCLSLAKSGFAFEVENRRDVNATPSGEFDIAVVEVTFEPFG